MQNFVSRLPKGLVQNGEDLDVKSPVSSVDEAYSSLVVGDQHPSLPQQVFNLTDVSLAWVSSTESLKASVTRFFHKDYLQISRSNLLCVTSEVSIPAEIDEGGVNQCWASPHSSRSVNLYINFDAQMYEEGQKFPLCLKRWAFREEKIQLSKKAMTINGAYEETTAASVREVVVYIILKKILASAFGVYTAVLTRGSFKQWINDSPKCAVVVKSFRPLIEAMKKRGIEDINYVLVDPCCMDCHSEFCSFEVLRNELQEIDKWG